MRRIAFLFVALLTFTAGCASSPKTSCSPGTSHCRCTSGNACSAGLVCQSGTCVTGTGSHMDGGGTPTDGGSGFDAGHGGTYDAGLSDAGTAYCGPDGGDAGPPTVPGDCSGGGPVPGCNCTTVGETQTCQNGKTITCNANGEFAGIWGPCLGSCFSSGHWQIDNLVPCFVSDGTTTYAYSSSIGSGGMATCGMPSALPPPTPTADWSTDSLTVDCQGSFTLCYTLKAGDGSAPSSSDCTVAQACTSGYYAMANAAQTLPPLGPWLGTDTACAQQFIDSGGYGEMSVVGVTADCQHIDDGTGGSYVFNRVTYCPSCCGDGSCSSNPMCGMCGMGGSGSF